MADENLELEGTSSKTSKSRKKLIPMLAAFLLVWVLAAVGNYFWLKATWTPPPPLPKPVEKEQITIIDLSDVQGYPSDEDEQPDSIRLALLDNSPRVDSLRTAIAQLTTQSATRDSLIRALAAAIEEAKKPAPIPETPAKPEADSSDVKRSVKLAKIVEAMAPADAAKMLEPLSDNMVTYILLRLKQRQAAQIMAALPANRAAGISRAIMEPLVQ
jgi:hypothetical protein